MQWAVAGADTAEFVGSGASLEPCLLKGTCVVLVPTYFSLGIQIFYVDIFPWSIFSSLCSTLQPKVWAYLSTSKVSMDSVS